MTGKMFPFITKKINVISGCPYDCYYCWAKRLAWGKLRKVERYKNGFNTCFNEKELRKPIKSGDFVFMTDMGDAFAQSVPSEYILRMIELVVANPKATFLFLTKNPKRYHEFHFPYNNAVLGTTLESNIDEYVYLSNGRKEYRKLSNAPPPSTRIFDMVSLDHPRKL